MPTPAKIQNILQSAAFREQFAIPLRKRRRSSGGRARISGKLRKFAEKRRHEDKTHAGGFGGSRPGLRPRGGGPDRHQPFPADRQPASQRDSFRPGRTVLFHRPPRPGDREFRLRPAHLFQRQRSHRRIFEKRRPDGAARISVVSRQHAAEGRRGRTGRISCRQDPRARRHRAVGRERGRKAQGHRRTDGAHRKNPGRLVRRDDRLRSPLHGRSRGHLHTHRDEGQEPCRQGDRHRNQRQEGAVRHRNKLS